MQHTSHDVYIKTENDGLHGQQLSTTANNCRKQWKVRWASEHIPVNMFPTNLFLLIFIPHRPSEIINKEDKKEIRIW